MISQIIYMTIVELSFEVRYSNYREHKTEDKKKETDINNSR